MAIYKDSASTNSLFAGRNLPSFVKDFVLKKYIDEQGQVNAQGLTNFLNRPISFAPLKCFLFFPSRPRRRFDGRRI